MIDQLKQISDVFDVTSSKRVFESDWTDSGVPFLRTREIVKLSNNETLNNTLFISEEMYEEYTTRYGKPEEGDLLITAVGTLGACYIVKNTDRFYFKDGNVIWLKKRGNVSSKYIQYCFKSPFVKKQIVKTANSAVVGTFTITNANKTQIYLPALDKQQKIASILDAADAVRKNDKALIEKYDELTQALFLDMFGDPVSNPKGWEKVEMKKLCSFKKKSIKPEDISEGVNYVALDSIEKFTGNITTVYNVDKGEIKSNKFWFDNSYILYGKLRPYLNKVALPDFEGICSTDIIPIQPIDKKTNKLFITSMLRHKSFVAFANERSSGANLPRISPSEVEKYSTINPPITLQNQFADRVALIEGQKAVVQKSLIKSEELFNSLMQKAFKGELV